MGANAQTTVPTFTASQVLTAAQMNASARTGVPVFSTTVTRDAGFGGTGEKTLAEGQLCYVEGTGLQTYNGTSWTTLGTRAGIVQVQSTTKSDTFTMASTTFADITGLSVSITPTSASNTVLIMAMVNHNGLDGVCAAQLRLMRDSTAIGLGDAAGSRTRVTASMMSLNGAQVNSGALMFLDSPASTSALTYKVQLRSDTGSTVYVNRNPDNTDSANYIRAISTITVLEVFP